MTATCEVNTKWPFEGGKQTIADGVTLALIPEVGASPWWRDGNEVQTDGPKRFPGRPPLLSTGDLEMDNRFGFAKPTGLDSLLD